MATEGTREALLAAGLEVELVLKVHQGRPHVVDAIKNRQIHLIVNTPSGQEAQADGRLIRRTAIAYKVPLITTIAGANATVAAIRSLQAQPLEVQALQDYIRA